VFDFEGGIESQNTIAGQEEGCAEAVRNLVPTMSVAGCFAGLVLRSSVLLDFEDGERVAFGIDEIDLPASAGDGEVGRATIPPSHSMAFAVRSKSSTSSEQTKALVPLSGGGASAASRAGRPRNLRLLSSREMGRPFTPENFQPNTWDRNR
jgi:hypothetical protein